MIEISSLYAGYTKADSLKDLSLSLSRGRICVLLGQNGSGKTTLLRTLSGELRYRGSIKIDGKELSEMAPREKAKKLSFMPQRLPEPQGVSVKRLVSFARAPYTGPFMRLSQNDISAVERAIKLVGITEFSERYVTSLSGGEKQKAFFAMIAAAETDAILLDEPTSFLDTQNKLALLRFLVQMKGSGKLVLAVLHDLSDALSVADDICVMNDGKIVFFGNKNEFLNKKIAETYFSERPVFVQNEDKIFFIHL